MLRLLESYLNLLARHYLRKGRGQTTIIAVAGSVGKTSTKVMIGELLCSIDRQARFSRDSYNSSVGLPLAVFDYQVPSRLKNPIAWLFLLVRCELQLLKKRPEFIVLELGIDAPGDMAKLTSVVQADYVVLTATTAEHLESLNDQQGAISEEISVLSTAKHRAFVGIDDVDTSGVDADYTTYGASDDAEWKIHNINYNTDKTEFLLHNKDDKFKLKTPLISLAGLKSLAATVAVGHELGIEKAALQSFAVSCQPHNGRMRLFAGLNGSQIIDDSYNSSPAAIVNALDTLSRRPQSKKLFIMGMINEMGGHLPGLLKDIQHSFKQADEVIIVGDELADIMQNLLVEGGIANRVVADALDAADMVRDALDDDTVVLVKGSQGDVYLEECVKLLLDNPATDARHLVRQSSLWMDKKNIFFKQRLKE